MVEKKQVVDYLNKINSEFRSVVPPKDRSWNDVIFRKGTTTASTRPDLYSYIVWGKPRMPALKEFASLLEADREFTILSKEIEKNRT